MNSASTSSSALRLSPDVSCSVVLVDNCVGTGGLTTEPDGIRCRRHCPLAGSPLMAPPRPFTRELAVGERSLPTPKSEQPGRLPRGKEASGHSASGGEPPRRIPGPGHSGGVPDERVGTMVLGASGAIVGTRCRGRQ